MYINQEILVGKSDDKNLSILPNMANRHGLITGASGSGKTITLKVMAESFSDAGVPVFLADVKGDLAGTAFAGESSDSLQKRIDNLKLEAFDYKAFPVRFWDIYGVGGHPIRATIADVGPEILSIMLGLSEAQEGNLAIAFAVAKDEGLKLIDLEDLRAVLQHVSDGRKTYTTKYGNITPQSIGVIQRSLLTLENQGANNFFGEPALNISDFFTTEADGRGTINIMHAVKLFESPDLYASFMLWLLTKLFTNSPEVGDLDKPRMVFFFDEAHLLFSGMPTYRLKRIAQIVKLIRSRGIGLYFISQAPTDIPDSIITQLGNRVQHTLRAYTPAEQKTVRAAAAAFRVNKAFDTEQAILELGTGEALISFLDHKGAPSVVEKAIILPPQSRMGAIDDISRQKIINISPLAGKYDETINAESAKEQLEKATTQPIVEPVTTPAQQLSVPQPAPAQNTTTPSNNALDNINRYNESLASRRANNAPAPAQEPLTKTEAKKAETAKTKAEKKQAKKIEKYTDRFIGNVIGRAGSKLGDKLFKNIFKQLHFQKAYALMDLNIINKQKEYGNI